MALHRIEFDLTPSEGWRAVAAAWSHTGVPGSGDLEVLIRRREEAAVHVVITTPVTGFDPLWKAVVTKAVHDGRIGAVGIEINDNNATPFVASTRLRQAFSQAREGGGTL